jgi:L-alanine-DL-glutamate epimerase-like enolase superfamily enzyme
MESVRHRVGAHRPVHRPQPPRRGRPCPPERSREYRRRLERDHEITFDAHQGFLVASQIAILLRRLDRCQLFDTL